MIKYRCPICGSKENFSVMASVGAVIDGDGRIVDIRTPDGELTIGPDSPMMCAECRHGGMAVDFVNEEED